MARPAKVAPTVFDTLTVEAKQAIETASEIAAKGYLPASVTGAWDQLGHALGKVVPYHVNQARASAQRLRTLR